MKYSLLYLLFALISCDQKEQLGKITIIKQWHLSAQTNTLDIEASKKRLQYTNQMDIYHFVSEQISSGKSKVVIAEGCEGEISDDFKLVYNGWSLAKLKQAAKQKNFEHIMAPVALKIKAKFPDTKVVCGDHDQLIKENLRAASDLRGFTGFYTKMSDAREKNKKRFNAYADQLQKLYPEHTPKDPVEFALGQAKASLDKFQQIIQQRNTSFFKTASKYYQDNPIIIIGGLHVADLEKRFTIAKKTYEVLVPAGYANDEQGLILAVEKLFTSSPKTQTILFQVPTGFNLKKFPLKKQIPITKLMTPAEKNNLEKLVKDKLNFNILLSDFDGDGIRDFTLSTNGQQLVLSAEDPDWDNDNIPNIIDDTVGATKIAQLEKISLNNHLISMANSQEILKQTKKHVTLVSSQGVAHEQLVLQIFNQLVMKTLAKKHHVKFLMSTKPSFSYGDNVFFSYVKHTQVMEYFPKKLNSFLNEEYQRRFKQVSYAKFIQAYAIPLIIHSLAHEIGHSVEDPELDTLMQKLGWSWQWQKYPGKYLKSHRHPKKQILRMKEKLRFKNKSFKLWLAEHHKYTQQINQILKLPAAKQTAALKSSKYSVNLTTAASLQQKLSFMATHAIPSLYALKKPAEHYAELYATCVYQQVFPKSIDPLRAVEVEHLLGIYPLASSELFCESIPNFKK